MRALWPLARRAQSRGRGLVWIAVSALAALGQALFVASSAAFVAGAGEQAPRWLALAGLGVLLRLASQGWLVAENARWCGRLTSLLQQQLLAPAAATTCATKARHSDHGSRLQQLSSTALSAQIEDVARALAEGLLPAARALLELVPLLALLAWSLPRAAWLSALLLPPFLWWLQRNRRALAAALQRQQAARTAALSRFEAAVRHDELWRVQGRSAEVRAQVAQANAAQHAARAEWALRAEWISGQNELFGVALIGVCVALSPQPGHASAELLRFFTVLFMAYRPLRALLLARLALRRGALSLAALPLRAQAAPEAPPPPARAWPVAELVLAQLQLPHACDARWELSLPPGGLLLVTGPSGAGKSTLLRALLGLVPLASGALRYGDEWLQDAGVGPHERPFSWLPQDCPLLGASVCGVLGIASRAELRPEHAALLEDVPEHSNEFSGGERQRLSLVLALRSAAPVLLLDEPTAHLDPRRAQQVADLLRAERRHGRALVVVSHEPARFVTPAPRPAAALQLQVYAAAPSEQEWAA